MLPIRVVLSHTLVRLTGIMAVAGAMLALVGCSAVQLAYNNAPTLLYFWLDGYADFDTGQADRVRGELEGLHQWHRREELPQIAALLKGLQGTARADTTPAQICDFVEQITVRSQAVTDRLGKVAAAVIPTLTPAQVEHMQKAVDKRNTEWRKEWLDGSPQELAKRRADQQVEQAETLYGSLSPAQRALIRAQIAASSFDAQRNYQENLRRQQDALQTLQRMRAGMPQAQIQDELQLLVRRMVVSTDPAYAAYRDKLTKDGCANLAALHNSTTAAQRDKLNKTLRGYEADTRELTQAGSR